MTHSPEARAAIQDVRLAPLRERLKGAQYRHLIQEHYRRDVTGRLSQEALQGTVSAFTSEERQIAEPLVDLFNRMGAERSFWFSDAKAVLDTLEVYLDRRLGPNASYWPDPLVFNLFQLITLNFVVQAVTQPKLRRHMGIRRNLFLP